ncbi:MAG: hypothetical protein M0Z82_05440 [Actinomycetota bacterium]|nr:hypothetical protein [Actinomycetota bacterium]
MAGAGTLVERLADIADELADLAIDRLHRAVDDAAGTERAALEAEERRLSQARRAVVRAMAALGGADDADAAP